MATKGVMERKTGDRNLYHLPPPLSWIGYYGTIIFGGCRIENSVRPLELTHSLSRKCSSKIKIKIFQIREKKKRKKKCYSPGCPVSQNSMRCWVSRLCMHREAHLPRTTGMTHPVAQWIKCTCQSMNTGFDPSREDPTYWETILQLELQTTEIGALSPVLQLM